MNQEHYLAVGYKILTLPVFVLKGYSTQVFHALDQNVEIYLKCILTKYEVSTHSRFQDNTVQN